MTIAETLLPEFDQEMATTRRVLVTQARRTLTTSSAITPAQSMAHKARRIRNSGIETQ
jgi:hypothetical protein